MIPAPRRPADRPESPWRRAGPAASAKPPRLVRKCRTGCSACGTAPLALGTSAGIDRRTAQRFSRGKIAIDGRPHRPARPTRSREAHGAATAFMQEPHRRPAGTLPSGGHRQESWQGWRQRASKIRGEAAALAVASNAVTAAHSGGDRSAIPVTAARGAFVRSAATPSASASRGERLQPQQSPARDPTAASSGGYPRAPRLRQYAPSKAA